MAAIVVDNLKKQYRSVEALKGISLEIEAGEIFGLVGPDGAGKTTLIRLLCGILTPTGGTANIEGFDVRVDPEGVKRQIGYMSQRFSLYPDLTVAENMSFFEELYKVPKSERSERTKRLLEFSRLGPFKNRPAGKLSGGMKQKLGLSCALIHTPKILFLDEPTTGVDPISRRELWSLLYDLWHGGMTIFVSTPYLDEAERCTRVGLLYEGNLISVGTPKEITGSYPYQVAEVTLPGARAYADMLERLDDVVSIQLSGERIYLSTTDFSTAEPIIRSALQETGVETVTVRRTKPSLETVFLELSGREK